VLPLYLVGSIDTTAVGLLGTAVTALSGLTAYLGRRLLDSQEKHSAELLALHATHATALRSQGEEHAKAIAGLVNDRIAEIRVFSEQRAAVAEGLGSFEEFRAAFERWYDLERGRESTAARESPPPPRESPHTPRRVR